MKENLLGLKLADGLTISNPCYQPIFREYVNQIGYIPDYLPGNHDRQQKEYDPENIVVGWAGTASDIDALERAGLLEAMRELLKLRPQVTLNLNFYGGKSEYQAEYPEAQQHNIKWQLHRSDWLDQLGQIDIGIAHSKDKQPFDPTRIRLLEFMNYRVPWISTRHESILDMGDFGTLVENHPDAWLKTLVSLVDNLKLYKKMAASGPYWYALSQYLCQNIELILSTFQSFRWQDISHHYSLAEA